MRNKKARPSRNQNPYGTCWAFSSIGLAESDLITKGQRDSSVDLSELQFIHFTYNSVTDPLSGTKGDYSKYYNDNASDSYLNKGGNYEMAVRRLSQWKETAGELISITSGCLMKHIRFRIMYGYLICQQMMGWITITSLTVVCIQQL